MSLQRTEFKAERTSCACGTCTALCRTMPGYLLPADLPRIAEAIAPKRLEDVLLASPGALVARGGKQFRIPTLVPARRREQCIFLSAKGECTIHAVSPFGCAFFDTHQAMTPSYALSAKGLQAVLDDWNSQGPYSELWTRLVKQGKTSPGPKVLRKGMHP